MQRIFNYGSTLQAYGLRRLIEKVDQNSEVRFVDYRPGSPLITDSTRAGTPSRLGRTISKVREYGRVDAPMSDRIRFFNHKRSYASRNFPAVGIPLVPDYDLRLDLQVIGSDEVFNCVQSNTNVGYSRDLFGHDSPARRLISYAASFGNTTLEKIERYNIASDLRADLAGFDHISVRDNNSARIIEALTGEAPTLNVDPVLAYDFMASEHDVPSTRLHDGRYLIVYGYSGRLSAEENALIRKFANQRGLRVLAFGGAQASADRFIDCNAFELLAWFRDAEAVITDTFHGTIFAMINQRPFATIVRRSSGHGYGNEEKLTHLLSTFGLPQRATTDLAALDHIFEVPLDTGAIQRTLDIERQRTINYLDRAVNGGSNS